MNCMGTFRKRYLLLVIIIFVILSVLYSNQQLGTKYNRSSLSNRRTRQNNEEVLYSSLSSASVPSGLLSSASSTLAQLRRRAVSSSKTTTSSASPVTLTTTCHRPKDSHRNSGKKSAPFTLVDDNLWLSRSYGVSIARTPLPIEVQDKNDEEDDANDNPPEHEPRKKQRRTRIRSSFRCAGDQTNTSHWRTRTCHYTNVCYHLPSSEWRFYKGKRNTKIQSGFNGIFMEDQLPTLFHAQPSQMMEDFIFSSSSSLSSPSLSTEPDTFLSSFTSFSSSNSASSSSSSSSSSKYSRSYHGYVSLTTEPQRNAPHLLADQPVSNDWAPTLIDTFVPFDTNDRNKDTDGTQSTLYYTDLYQLYIPTVPIYDKDDDLDETFLQWMQQPEDKNEASTTETIDKRTTSASSSSTSSSTKRNPFRPSERPYCDPKFIQQFMYDIFGPLYAAKATLGLVTEHDLTGDTTPPWSTDPTRSCDPSASDESEKISNDGSRILLLDSTLQEKRMQKLMYDTFIRTRMPAEAREVLLNKIHRYFTNVTWTAENLAAELPFTTMDMFSQCRHILPLLAPAVDILRESELLAFARKKQVKNICFQNLQVGGTISYRFPERIWTTADDSNSNPRTYTEGLQQYPSLKDRNTLPHDAMDQSNGLVNGNVLYSNINFHRIPLLWEYRNSILLKYSLSPLYVPSAHQFVILEEDSRNPLRPTIANMDEVYAWLRTAYPVIPIHRINLYNRYNKQYWEYCVPLLLNSTILISNYGTVAQITAPFLPIGGVSILIDLPVNSPYYSSETVTDTSSSKIHGRPLETNEFMENHHTEFSGISYFRSLTPDAPILNTFAHIQTLSYQVRTYEDIIEQEVEKVADVPSTVKDGNDREAELPIIETERILRIKLRKEKLLHLVERGLHLWEQQENEEREGKKREKVDIGRLYPHYGPEITENL